MEPQGATETAVLGGGCFWCTEAVFRDLRGVTRVASGYAGGRTDNPTYREVCGGDTGHAEAVEVTFDPRELSYEDLLRVFFTIHDPTTLNRQGADVGTQYRSVVFPRSAAQREAAERVMAEIAAEDVWPSPLVTTIEATERFYPAEAEHEDYFARNPWSGYCRAVIAPKLQKFRKTFADRVRRPAA